MTDEQKMTIDEGTDEQKIAIVVFFYFVNRNSSIVIRQFLFTGSFPVLLIEY